MPDYGKQYSGTAGKGQPRHKEHNAPGSSKKPFGSRPDKAELLARLAEKAAKARAAANDAANDAASEG